MDTTSDNRNVVEQLAEDFAERYRRGERPSLTEYTDRYPQFAEDIRDLFPALVVLERLKPGEESLASESRSAAKRPRRERLGDYRILREIGRGGMGVVYEAEQESLGRYVALKVLAPHGLLNGTFQERFRREAKAAAKLHHTNIVPVFGVGEADGYHFYAMQFIRGEGLDKVLQDLRRLRNIHRDDTDPNETKTFAAPERSVAGTLLTGLPAGPAEIDATLPKLAADGNAESARPVEPSPTSGFSTNSSGANYHRGVARIGLQAAEALAYAHRQGVLHRDIKPSNLLLDMLGTLWITDFGLAKAEGSEDLTHTGDIVGTIRYMAPERFAGHSDARADVYALGATLYEMLTLQPAFQSTDKLKLIAQITKEEPPHPRTLDPQIPRDLETIVLKAMAQDPAARYFTAEDMAEDLRRFLADRPVKARRASSLELVIRWRRRNPAVAALLGTLMLLLAVIAVGASLAAAQLKHERDAALGARHEADDATASMKEKLWQSQRDQAKAGIVSRRRGQRFESLETIRSAVALGKELGLPLEKTDELRNLAIAALTLPDIKSMREWKGGFANGYTKLTCDARFERYARADREGNISIRTIADDVEIISFKGLKGDSWMQFSPDGRFFSDNQYGLLMLWRLDGGSARPLPVDHGAFTPCFTRDGRLVFISADAEMMIRDFDSDQPARTIVAIPGVEYMLKIDPRSERFACTTGKGIQVRDLRTGALIKTVAGPFPATALAWHPEGDLLAFVDDKQRARVWDVVNDRELAVLEGMTSSGIRVTFAAGGNVLVTTGWEGKLRFWDWHSGRQSLIQDGGFLESPWFCDTMFVQSDGPASTALWQVESAREYRTISLAGKPDEKNGISALLVHPSGRISVQGTTRGTELYDLAQGLKLATLSEGKEAVYIDSAGDVLTNTPRGLFRHPIQYEPGVPPRLIIGAPERLDLPCNNYWMSKSRDGRVLAVGVGMGAAYTVDGKTPRLVPHWDCRGATVSRDGRWIATASHNGTAVKVWGVEDGKLARELLPDCSQFAIGFTPGGHWLATRSMDLRLWQIDTWEPGPILGIAKCYAFNPDDSLAAVESGGGHIRLIELPSGRELARLDDPNQDEANSLAFSPDGTKLIASTNIGKAIHIWDLRRIRAGLAEMGLDWDAAAYPPATEEVSPARIVLEYPSLSGKAAKPAKSVAPAAKQTLREIAPLPHLAKP